MNLSEMEEHIKNLNGWADQVAPYLPLLATKEDLKAFATKKDLEAFATKEDLKPLATKEFVLDLIQATRGEIRQVDQKLTSVADDVRKIAEQVAILTARKRRRHR